MNTHLPPNQVKFVYMIEKLEESIKNQELYRVKISFKNKKFYLFNVGAYLDTKGNRLFYLSDILSSVLSYQHKDLLMKRLNVSGYDGYINSRLNRKELQISIDFIFQRSKNLLYENQTYSKGRLVYDIVDNLYQFIEKQNQDNQDNQEPIMLENDSFQEDDLSKFTDNEITSNYSDEGDSIDAFVKIKNAEFYGEFILSIQKNPDETVNISSIKRFNYLVDKLKDLVDNMIEVNMIEVDKDDE